MESKEFNDIRKAYIDARAEERANLIKLLRENNYTVVTGGRAGQGFKDYSGGGKLDPPHDLRHHKWIDAQKERIKFLISLNPYEVDASSANPHHLYDRIGVQAYIGENKENDIRTAMIITKWSLPISKEAGNDFINFLEKIASMFTIWLD